MALNKPKILLFCEWFPPAFKAGGPIQSCFQFCMHLQPYYQIYVVTGTYDLGETTPLKSVSPNKWVRHEAGFFVHYTDPKKQNLIFWRALLRRIEPDFVYLNSMFSPRFSFMPLLMLTRSKWGGKVVLAPRGMLRSSALSFKSTKKKIFLNLLKKGGLTRNISFQATDDGEFRDIKLAFPQTRVVQAGNLPVGVCRQSIPVIKNKFELRLLFSGRVHPIKGLSIALEALKNISGNLVLSVVGALEDPVYAQNCREMAAALPAKIQVNFLGEMPRTQLSALMEAHHALLLPTSGENFGHAIFEHLAIGRPVIISDQTPWVNLAEKKAGWDLPLSDVEAFTKVIQHLVDMGQPEYETYCEGARQLAHAYAHDPDLLRPYFQLFPL